MDKERFITDKIQSKMGSVTIILTDNESGVQYLYFRYASGGGMTVLVDEDGKPILNKNI